MNKYIQTFISYAIFIRWLLFDSLWRKRWMTLTILTTGFLGVFFQLKVFALIVFYARHFSSGDRIIVAGYTLNPRSSMGLLSGGSFVVALLLVLSALCIYFSKRRILRMGREYEEFCSKRVFFLLGMNLGIISSEDESAKVDSYLMRLIRSDSRLAGRTLRMLLSLITPGLTLLVVVAILLYLEAGLTLAISVLAVAFFFFQYRVSRYAAEHSVRFEKTASFAASEYKGLLQHFKMQTKPDKSSALVEQVFAKGPVKNQLDAYDGRLRAVEDSRLVSSLFMAVVVGIIILTMGRGIIIEGEGWGRLMVYVIGLRYAMANLQTTFSSITAINRFYPQIKRYLLFVDSVAPQRQNQYPPLEEYKMCISVERETEALQGSLETIMIPIDARLALGTPIELNRYTLTALTMTMLGGSEAILNSAIYSMRFITTKPSCPHVSLRDALGMGPKAKRSDLRAWFPDEEMYQSACNLLPGSLDRQVKPTIWKEVTPKLKYCLGLISILMSDCRWVILEARGLKLLGLESARFYLDLFKDRIMVVVYCGDLKGMGSFGESMVAIADEDKLVGVGTLEWFVSVREQAEKIVGIKKNKKNLNAAMHEEDESDVEE